MTPNEQALRDKGFLEVSPGVWSKSKNLGAGGGVDGHAVEKDMARDDHAANGDGPHLLEQQPSRDKHLPARTVRLRQSSKPLMNKLESRLFAYLHLLYPTTKIHVLAKRYRLANGLTYTPDFCASPMGKETCFEAKGPYAREDSMIKLKVAAATYPEVDWFLYWELNGQWCSQKIEP